MSGKLTPEEVVEIEERKQEEKRKAQELKQAREAEQRKNDSGNKEGKQYDYSQFCKGLAIILSLEGHRQGYNQFYCQL